MLHPDFLQTLRNLRTRWEMGHHSFGCYPSQVGGSVRHWPPNAQNFPQRLRMPRNSQRLVSRTFTCSTPPALCPSALCPFAPRALPLLVQDRAVTRNRLRSHSRTLALSPTLPKHSAQPFLIVLVVVANVIGCGGAQSVSPQAATPNDSVLLPYGGPIRVLFDDSFDPEVFAHSSLSSPSDMRLLERFRSSAFVVPAVVVTVTEQHQSDTGHVDLELLPVAAPLHGSLAPHFAPGEPIRLEIRTTDAGYSALRANQSELIGKRLNLFWNRFLEGLDARSHWHACSDSPKTKLALLRAAAIVNVD